MHESERMGPEEAKARDAHEREALLRAELAKMKERLERTTDFAHDLTPKGKRPSSLKVRLLGVVVLAVACSAFFVGYLPRVKRDATVVAETRQDAEAAPIVNTVDARRAPVKNELQLPGSVQAVSEAPILARADGYLKRRLVDIGDRVAAGQLMGEIEAPELDEQVSQAKASLQQALAAQEQAGAGLEQARANEQLARITAQRWGNLLMKGAVSRQDNDVYQSQAQAQSANVRALERSVAAARSSVEASRANVARLEQMQSYRQIRAPFAGVVTVRNVDTGALISAGQTMLFRIAQASTLRTYVNVPQAYAEAIHAGAVAHLTFADRPGRVFEGRLTRSANALDPNSRTLLAEVQLANTDGALMPGMYCQVLIEVVRQNPPLIIPGDTLMLRPQGPTVAVVTDQSTIHMQRIVLGRDFGREVEVLQGVQEGQSLVANPNDDVREGARVKAVKLKAEETGAASQMK